MTFSLGVLILQLVLSFLVLALWGVLAAMGLRNAGCELKTTIAKHAVCSPTRRGADGPFKEGGIFLKVWSAVGSGDQTRLF